MIGPLDLTLAEPLEIEGLTPAENREITLRRREALAATGRIELDGTAMPLLVQAFIAVLGTFPLDAVNLFYELRDELPASIPDAELIDALAAAASRLGGDVEAIDVAELARELRQKDDNMSSYSITDAAGHTYFHDPRLQACGTDAPGLDDGFWGYDEYAPGWSGEQWEADYDD